MFFEGQFSNYFFSTGARREGGGINLIVSYLDLWGCLCDKRKADFRPLSIAPLCSNYEGYRIEVVGSSYFYCEEEIGRIFTLKIIYG